jgi:hypothetical protein
MVECGELEASRGKSEVSQVRGRLKRRWRYIELDAGGILEG